ncbi:hypothetical protein EN792_062185, partial [Mesorhizobium sp. M00.F.Ca.ET.149.01.1.1]
MIPHTPTAVLFMALSGHWKPHIADLSAVVKPGLGLGAGKLNADPLVLPAEFDPQELEREQHVILQEIGAAHDTP